MSPTWLELAVALILLWVAWRLGLALAPWVIARFRGRSESAAARPRKEKLITATNEDRHVP